MIETEFRPKETKRPHIAFEFIFSLNHDLLATFKRLKTLGAFREIEVRGGTPFDYSFLFVPKVQNLV